MQYFLHWYSDPDTYAAFPRKIPQKYKCSIIATPFKKTRTITQSPCKSVVGSINSQIIWRGSLIFYSDHTRSCIKPNKFPHYPWYFTMDNPGYPSHQLAWFAILKPLWLSHWATSSEWEEPQPAQITWIDYVFLLCAPNQSNATASYPNHTLVLQLFAACVS